jgi:hypothetical protein
MKKRNKLKEPILPSGNLPGCHLQNGACVLSFRPALGMDEIMIKPISIGSLKTY